MAKRGKKLGWKSIFKDSKSRRGVDSIGSDSKIKPMKGDISWRKHKKGDR